MSCSAWRADTSFHMWIPNPWRVARFCSCFAESFEGRVFAMTNGANLLPSDSPRSITVARSLSLPSQRIQTVRSPRADIVCFGRYSKKIPPSGRRCRHGRRRARTLTQNSTTAASASLGDCCPWRVQRQKDRACRLRNPFRSDQLALKYAWSML